MRPSPLVTGDDLIAAGHTRGQSSEEILDAVEDAQLEGRLASREQHWNLCVVNFPAKISQNLASAERSLERGML